MRRQFLLAFFLLMFSSFVLARTPAPKIKCYAGVSGQPGHSKIPSDTLLIRLGYSVTLFWSAKHADYVDINGTVLPTRGFLTVYPTEDTNLYTLTAHKDGTPSSPETVTVYVCVSSNCAGGPR